MAHALENIYKQSRALYVLSSKLLETIGQLATPDDTKQKPADVVSKPVRVLKDDKRLNKIASKLYSYISSRLERSSKTELVIDRKTLCERFEFSNNGVTCAMKELANKGYIKYKFVRFKSKKSHHQLVHFIVEKS